MESAIWAGADTDAANPLDGGRTALHYACLAGQRATAQVLVEHGANPSAVDALGFTPADACASGGKDPRGDIAGDLELARAAHAHMASLAVKINAGTYDVDEPTRRTRCRRCTRLSPLVKGRSRGSCWRRGRAWRKPGTPKNDG